jgi:hypothetical protein
MAIMADVFDLVIPHPALFGRIGWRSEPPCNGGSAKKPPKPAPSPAPVRADSAAGEQAAVSAGRREGLRKTIDPANPLAPKSALGSIGALGSGGEGVMTNTYVVPKVTPRQEIINALNRR